MKTYLIRPICIVIFVLSLGSSCNRNSSDHALNNSNVDSGKTFSKSEIHFKIPHNNESFTSGKEIIFEVKNDNEALAPDSIVLLIDGITSGSIKSTKGQFQISSENMKMGSRNAEAVAFFKDKHKEYANIVFKLLASSPPYNYNYKIVKVYPHDINAFTQGLIYEDGYLFEGTGEYNQSSLRKEKLNNGEIILSVNLPSEVFGEGVTVFDDKIIQVTWKEQTAFIFNKANFNLINKIHYSIGEGWGITYNGKNLIMSDGSSYLYFLNKEDLSESDRVEVCDDKGPVKNLNELEYIDGNVWANVWQSDYIIKINPKNGEVTGKLDLSGLLKPNDKLPNTDVLNGIAYISTSKHFIVTGKNWPKLFEISVFK